MGAKQRFVVFGHNHLIGDLVDLIHLNGGVLSTIVENVEERRIDGRKMLADRLPLISETQEGLRPDVIPLREFGPRGGESYAIGFSGQQMQPLVHRLREKFALQFCTLIHPSAQISETATIAAGCVINSGAIIASGAQLGEHVFINRGATIGHDSVLERYSIIQPGADLAGYVRVGEGAAIGIGASVIEDITIGSQSVVAAGATVIRDVPPGVLVAGVPAKPKKVTAIAD